MRIFKNLYLVSLITKINIVIFTFISSIIINRFLGPALKGEYAYVINYVNIFSLIMTLSIARAIPYYIKKYGIIVYKQFVNIIYLQTIIFLIITLILNVFIPNKIVILITFLSAINQFYQQLSYIAIIKNIRLKNILSLADLFTYVIILVLVFFMSTKNKLDIIYYIYIFKLIVSIILYIITYKIYPTKQKIEFNKYREYILFGVFPTITALLITFNYKIDIIIIKSLTNFTQLGLYSLSVNLASMLWFIPDAFKDVLFHKTAKKDSINDINFSIKINTYISILIIIGFILIGKNFISIIYGKAFTDSYPITILLFFGNIPIIFFKMINTLYIARGKQKKGALILIITVLLNILINYIMIPTYGITGAAIASIISYSICGTAFLFSYKKEYKLTFNEVFVFNKKEIKKIKTLFIRR